MADPVNHEQDADRPPCASRRVTPVPPFPVYEPEPPRGMDRVTVATLAVTAVSVALGAWLGMYPPGAGAPDAQAKGSGTATLASPAVPEPSVDGDAGRAGADGRPGTRRTRVRADARWHHHAHGPARGRGGRDARGDDRGVAGTDGRHGGARGGKGDDRGGGRSGGDDGRRNGSADDAAREGIRAGTARPAAREGARDGGRARRPLAARAVTPAPRRQPSPAPRTGVPGGTGASRSQGSATTPWAAPREQGAVAMPRDERGEAAFPGRARGVALRDGATGGEHRGAAHRREGREHRVRRDDGRTARRPEARKGRDGQASPSASPSGASARPGEVRELARRWCDDNMSWDGVLWRSCHAYIERQTTM
ncbi:hypothetical protein GCM10010486_32770 [Nonomuraea roseoviolacea subsp. carminata]